MAERRRYSADIDSTILKLQGEGLPRQQIADQLGIPITKVHKLLRKHGATITPEQRRVNKTIARRKNIPDYPPDIRERVAELKQIGTMTNREIADTLGVSFSKVLVEIRKSDVRLTSEQKARLHDVYSPIQKTMLIRLTHLAPTCRL